MGGRRPGLHPLRWTAFPHSPGWWAKGTRCRISKTSSRASGLRLRLFGPCSPLPNYPPLSATLRRHCLQLFHVTTSSPCLERVPGSQRWPAGKAQSAHTVRSLTCLRHLGTIAQLSQAISSQLHVRHVSTIGKHVKKQYLLRMFPQYGELRPISG